jgi:toxin-antitoxin system, toxin component, Txe/YoeB family
MRRYEVEISAEAENDILKLRKTGERATLKKLDALLVELEIHPKSGTGHPEQLKNRTGLWSRRITQKHRLVYRIDDNIITVLVLSSYGHYGDK